MRHRSPNLYLRGIVVCSSALVAVASGASSHGQSANSADAAWRKEARPFRTILDWRPADMEPGRTAELFLETAKFESATGAGRLTPASFTFVAEKAGGLAEEMPFDAQTGIGQYNKQGIAFRMVPPRDARRLWMYFGGAEAASEKLATRWNLIEAFTDPASIGEWKLSHPNLTIKAEGAADARGLRIAFDGKLFKVPLYLEVSRSFQVPEDCRGLDAFLSLDLKVQGEGYVPMSIQLQQFDKDSKRLDACVVDPRWLTICMAAGQDIRFRERGYIYPGTASVTMAIALHGSQARDKIMNADGTWLKYPDTDAFDVQVTKAEMRAAHPICFPGFEKSRYAPGASGVEGDLAFHAVKGTGICFDGFPPAVCTEDRFPTNPSAYRWPCGAGTFECWIMPEWSGGGNGRRFILQTGAGVFGERTVFSIYYTPDTGTLHAGNLEAKVALTPQQWHHIAFTWNPEGGRRELFVNGEKAAGSEGQTVRAGKPGDVNVIPGRVWIGQSHNVCNEGVVSDESFHGRIDEIRVSDGVRYTAAFTPQRTPFTLDQNTRALFHLDGRTDGVQSGEDPRVACAFLSPMPQTAVALAFEKRGGVGMTEVEWLDAAVPDDLNPLKLFPVRLFTPPGAGEYSKAFVERSVALRLEPGETATVNCAGSPRMEWVEVRCPDDGQPIEAPFLARPGEADPRTLQKLAASLGLARMASDRERSDAVFKYLVNATNYYMYHQADIQPSGEVIDPGGTSPYSALNLNSYRQFECGDLNTLTQFAFLGAGLSANITYGTGHMFEQVFYEGSWHLYDLSPRLFFPARDNSRAATLAEVQEDPYLIMRAPSVMSLGSYLLSYSRPFEFASRHLAAPAMTYRLRPGEAFRYHWYNAGRYNPTIKDITEHSAPWREGSEATGQSIQWGTRFPPYIGNGVFSFSCTPREDHPALSNWNNGEFVYKFFTPYVICGAVVNATSGSSPAPALSISYDEGKTWKPAPAARTADGMTDLDRLCVARHFYWLKVTPAAGGKVERFEHQAIVEMNPSVLTPALSKGDNKLVFTADTESAAEITVQYQEEDAAELEVVGGLRFGWAQEHEGQLIVCQPGKTLEFDVKGSVSEPGVTAPMGARTTVARIGAGNKWHVTMALPESLKDGLYNLDIKSGDHSRSVVLLAARDAQIVTAEQARTEGKAVLTDDPDKVRGKVLLMETGSTAVLPLAETGATPLAVFALAKYPEGTSGRSAITTATGSQPFIEPNIAYAYHHQDHLRHEWKWYHPRNATSEWWYLDRFVAVRLPQPPSVTIKGITGSLFVDAVVVLPATDERLIESVMQCLFSANYRPWLFDRDWGPITVGIPYSVK